MLDLTLRREPCPWPATAAELLQPLAAGDLNAFMALRPAAWRRCAPALSRALRRGQRPRAVPRRRAWCRRPTSSCALPCAHRRLHRLLHRRSTTPPTVGKLFRPDNPLLPNYKWVPIGYHGRASSIVRQRPAVRAAAGPDRGRRRRRAGASAPSAAARLRARAGRLRRRRQRARRADRRSTQAEDASVRHGACSTTGRRATSRPGSTSRSGPSWRRTSPPRSRPGS
ncbi:MAG: hypothetical protein MZW92_29575 [Comamonadaceae bacterium]|nr:hypothetical protein [Comamonadaceae bacterium]